MFDTMTLTKVVGGFCGAFLVFLLGGWAAETIYHVGGSGHGEEHEAAWIIETDEGEGESEEEAPADFATLWQSRDEGAGERVFNQCRACHKLDGANAVGPHLDGVVGREVDSVEGFSYTGALEEVADVWTGENLFHFLENPQGYAPGTAMSYSGLSSAEDRVNLIAYLTTYGGDPMVGEPAAAGGDEAAAEGEGGDAAAAEGEGGDQAAAEGEGSEQAAAEGDAASEGEGSEQAAAEGDAASGGEASGQAAAEEQSSGDAASGEAPAEDQSSAEGEGDSQSADASSSEGGEAAEGGSGGGSEVAAMVQSADASAGENVFNRCRACHKVDGSNGVGPHLDGVVGRDIGSVEDFNYSGALSEHGDVWTPDNLFAFLENPREWAPGTKMSFAGLRSEEERANVIAYLQSLGGQ